MQFPSINPNIKGSVDFEKEPIKIVFFGSGNGSNFEALQQQILDKKVNAQIVLVVFDKKHAYIQKRAENYEIPAFFANREEYSTKREYYNEIRSRIMNAEAELLVLGGWMKILPDYFIAIYDNHIINIHPSILPAYKGKNAIGQALEGGAKFSGTTVHYVIPEVDSGKIIIQGIVPIYESDGYQELQKRVQQVEHKILPEAIRIWQKNHT